MTAIIRYALDSHIIMFFDYVPQSSAKLNFQIGDLGNLHECSFENVYAMYLKSTWIFDFRSLMLNPSHPHNCLLTQLFPISNKR
jgi:hypothetical protein